ncbi:hypothetical protein C482_02521 [Natrialba chahannaoensis JCM 10990]|uniref:Uncharacterized protein n=1 Tax=Natrialba chahannaoensis JCM 10990 TaxID=1227492 RepID=M0B5U8_9EURY|nr:hypothetical protein C482_02521 [Natrialba chahannaoensis JCM 10990]
MKRLLSGRTVDSAEGFRRTFVGLKRRHEQDLDADDLRFRRTFVGLKQDYVEAGDAELVGFRRTFVGLKRGE